MSLTHSQDFPTDKIWVNREERQRKTIDISDMIESVRQRGILHPVLIKADGELIFGERRWTTATFLKMPMTPVRIVENMSAEELQVIELEENIKRKQLPWQEEAAAALRIHNLYLQQNPEWKVADTGRVIGWGDKHTPEVLAIAEAIADGDKSVAEADTFRAARTILTRRRQRQQDSALNAIASGEFILDDEQPALFADDPAADAEPEGIINLGSPANGAPELKPIVPVKPKPAPVIEPPYKIEHADMSERLADYTGPKFNMLHMDLPYGVKLNGQANQDSFEGGGYDSNPEIYWNLLGTILDKWPTFMFESSHFMCWISMEFYVDTIALFKEKLADHDLFICATPLIWHKTDNRGIISDAKRRPRNVYEACLFGSTGDRYIVKPGSNVYGAPTAKSTAIHTNEKPIPMLREFMMQFVDEHSRVLDPTCGSGSAIRAAELLKAESAIGWEFNEDFATRAQDRLLRDRNLAALSDKVSS
jgi:ParB-like chromosome segregation protein Spo0J